MQPILPFYSRAFYTSRSIPSPLSLPSQPVKNRSARFGGTPDPDSWVMQTVKRWKSFLDEDLRKRQAGEMIDLLTPAEVVGEQLFFLMGLMESIDLLRN